MLFFTILAWWKGACQMCGLEKDKLLEVGNAMPEEQKVIIIQTFPIHIIANEIVRRDMLKDTKITGCEQSLQYG